MKKLNPVLAAILEIVGFTAFYFALWFIYCVVTMGSFSLIVSRTYVILVPVFYAVITAICAFLKARRKKVNI